MRILVTGSAGFLARSLIPKLQAENYYVIGIDLVEENLSNKNYKIDLRSDLSFLNIKFDLCIHLASSVGGFLFNACNTWLKESEIKILNQLSLLCQNADCTRIIFTSSTNVFESSSEYALGPIKTFDQITPYAKSKVAIEKLIPNLFQQFTIIRPTNLFGPDQERTHLKIGESHVIPDLIHKINTSISDSIEVLGDGTQVRNFLHVSDMANCILLMLQNNILGWFNIRSEIHISIAELANILIRLSHKDLKIVYKPEYAKFEPVTLRRFDVTPLLSHGWYPRINSIEEGLTDKFLTNQKFMFPYFAQNSLE